VIDHAGLDAVILAGGKSERLNGVVPPYFKPFVVIEGRSLLVAAVDSALAMGARRVIVVSAGENALPVFQLVGHRPEIRVMLATGGPGRALRRGLELCQTQRVLVLMSDNIHGPEDVYAVCTAANYAVGVRVVHRVEAERFTRLRGDRWVERRYDQDPLDDEVAKWSDDATQAVTVWCGPLVIDRYRGLNALAGQEKIGPVLNEMAPSFALVHVLTQDIGTPDAVRRVT